MRIEQGYVSPALSHLEDEFLDRWNLKKYNNENEPSVFFGLYFDWDEELKCSKNISKDVNVYNNHDGFKVLLCGGIEYSGGQFNMVDKESLNLVAVDDWEVDACKREKLPYKHLKISYFDFNKYPRTKLGDKIYSHIPLRENSGDWGKNFEKMFHYERLMNLFGEDRFCFPKEWVTPQECIKYFNKSFVNIKPHRIRGQNTSWKLGSMGRNTIAVNLEDAPNYLHYDSDDELKRLVDEESKKIGTIQENKLWDYFHQSDDWLHEEYWK